MAEKGPNHAGRTLAYTGGMKHDENPKLDFIIFTAFEILRENERKVNIFSLHFVVSDVCSLTKRRDIGLCHFVCVTREKKTFPLVRLQEGSFDCITGVTKKIAVKIKLVEGEKGKYFIYFRKSVPSF